MIRKAFVWFGIKLYGLSGKLYGLERNCMVSNHESYGLGHKIHTWNCELRCFISYYQSLVSKWKKYSAYIVKFMNDCLMENHGFEIHLMSFCERTTQQLIELDAFTFVIKHHTVETNINMFNNVICPLTQNILKITGIMSLKFGTPHCLQGTPFLGTHGVPGTPKC